MTLLSVKWEKDGLAGYYQTRPLRLSLISLVTEQVTSILNTSREGKKSGIATTQADYWMLIASTEVWSKAKG